MTESIKMFIFSSTSVMSSMSSVERIHTYAKSTLKEAEWDLKDPRLVGWPSKGEIELQNLSVRYRDNLPLVLKGITVHIKAGEKVAIVGRTGSGKSTVLLCLMRILEKAEDVPGNEESFIKIDGIKISSIGLHELRGNIAMIPQEPILFEGTVRSSVDPRGIYEDDEIFNILTKLNFPETILNSDLLEQKGQGKINFGLLENIQERPVPRTNPQTKENSCIKIPLLNLRDVDRARILDHKVEKYGCNLSVGQRQIIAIARSLIKKPKILLMDEATANIDQRTDEVIKKVIGEITGITVVTIAHRISTVVGYDRILVFDRGSLVEQGTFDDLVKQDGIFSKLAQEVWLDK